MNKSTLKAYTIMEVLITLVISTIVIALVYTVFLYLDQQMVRYQNHSTAIQEYKILEQILKRDLYGCEYVRQKDIDQIDLINYDESVISYKKDGSILLRKSHQGSYINVGIPVLNWNLETSYQPNKSGVLLKVTTVLSGDTISLRFPKMKTEMRINSNI